ncbi:hypothetical protein FKW77_000408 [Venturia effusa]|uniref:Uncharacterized protein n=1 Tax=Venturia effusa TaxID=50376 RepID=A0A517L4N9_9PEZI|nr:hypothetical protein FKW77_000408 [Venturia effusa]
MSKLSKLWKRLSFMPLCQDKMSKEQHSTNKIDDEAPKVALRLPSIILVPESIGTESEPVPPASLPRHMVKREASVACQNRPGGEELQCPPELASLPVAQFPEEPSPRALLLEIKADLTSISDKIDGLAYESTRARIDLGIVKMEALEMMLQRSDEEIRVFRTVSVAKMVDEIEGRMTTQIEHMERRLSRRFMRTTAHAVVEEEIQVPVSERLDTAVQCSMSHTCLQ